MNIKYYSKSITIIIIATLPLTDCVSQNTKSNQDEFCEENQLSKAIENFETDFTYSAQN